MAKQNDIGKLLREWMDLAARRSIRDVVLYCREKGLSMSQFSVLCRLRFRGGCSVSEIAEDAGISRAAASQLAERLVQLDLVVRSEAPYDRRVKLLVLTEKAQALLRESDAAREKWIDELVRNLTFEERTVGAAGIRALTDRARQLRKEP